MKTTILALTLIALLTGCTTETTDASTKTVTLSTKYKVLIQSPDTLQTLQDDCKGEFLVTNSKMVQFEGKTLEEVTAECKVKKLSRSY